MSLTKLIESISLLKRDELASNGIVLKCITSRENISLYCDHSLIEHVLLNLVNNSADALISKSESKEKLIEISGSAGEDHRPLIMVKDNGIGIPDVLLENVFIPFFTTKEHGSGIGLSLARQIMKLHGGTISVFSKPGVETVFSLVF